MKFRRALLLSVPLVALALAHAGDAAACGGCFVPPEENTQVTGHRMILSVSKDATTLYDQIEYSGDPSSFAWVLPIKGQVEIGLSSDALFAFLEQATHVDVYPPPLDCPPPPQGCYPDEAGGDYGSAGATAGAGGGGGGGVTVVSQQVVGPYETVQLSSSDPNALSQWLADHGYNIPNEIQPVVQAYVQDGFDFLALKLVPGQGVEAMRPVRVTTPGAAPVLPLRMVAAGTGATTKITLWVMGEGRYETTNFPTFTVDPAQLEWNWDTSESNLATLEQQGFAASNGLGWLVESAAPFSTYSLQDTLGQVVQIMPEQSGYGDANGNGAQAEYDDDVAHLFGTISPGSMWLDRLHAELPRVALASDLYVGASADQTQVANQLQAKKSVGQVPACPDYSWCSGGSSTGAGMGGGLGWVGGTGDGNGDAPAKAQASGGCAIGGQGDAPAAAFAGLGLALAAALVRRRRSR